jgi:hypothetical protein
MKKFVLALALAALAVPVGAVVVSGISSSTQVAGVDTWPLGFVGTSAADYAAGATHDHSRHKATAALVSGVSSTPVVADNCAGC